MQSAGQIFFDFLLNAVKYGNFFAVYDFFYSLSVFVFSRNFCGYLNSLKIIFFLNTQCNQAFRNLTYFF